MPFASKKQLLLAASLVAFVFIFIAIWVPVREGLLTKTISRYVENGLTDAIGEGVSLEKLTINFLPFSIRIKEINIDSQDYTLRLEETVVRLSLWSLLTEKIYIKELTFSNPVLVVKRLPQDAVSLPFSSKGMREKKEFIIRKIEVKNGKISIKDDENSIDVEHISASLFPDLLFKRAKLIYSAGPAELKYGKIRKTFSDITGKLNLTRDLLVIKETRVESDDFSFDLNGDIKDFSRPILNLYFKAKSKLSVLTGGKLPFDSNFTLACSINGDARSPDLYGVLELESVSGWDMLLGSVSSQVNYSWGENDLMFDKIKLSLAQGSVSTSMNINFSAKEPFYSGKVTVMDLDMAVLEKKLPGYPLQGRLNGEWSYEGSRLENIKLDGWVRLKRNEDRNNQKKLQNNQPKIPPILLSVINDIEAVYADFAYADGKIRIRQGEVKSDIYDINLFGNASAGELDLNLIAYSRHVSKILEYFCPPLIGDNATLVGRLTGSLSDPRLESHVWGKDIFYKGKVLGDLHGGLTYYSKRLGFVNARIRSGKTRYWLNGGIDIVPGAEPGSIIPQLDIDIAIRSGSPNTFISMYYKELPFDMLVDGYGNINNTTTVSPWKYGVTLELELSEGTIYGQKLDSGRVRLEIENRHILFKDGLARKGDDRFFIEGMIDFSGGYSVQLETEGFELADIHRFAEVLPLVSGRIAGRLTGTGNFLDAKLQAEASLENFIINGRKIGNFNGEVSLNGHNVSYQVSSGEELEIFGDLSLGADFPYKGELLYSRLRLQPEDLGLPLRITASGLVRFAGSLLDWESLEAAIDTSSFELSPEKYDYMIGNDGNLVFKYSAATGIKIENAVLKGPDFRMKVDGLIKKDEVSIFVEGNSDLKVAGRFISLVETINGDISFSLHISNRLTRPEVAGEVRIKAGSLKLEKLRESIDFDDILLLFNKYQVVVESFSGSLWQGKINANGIFDIADLDKVDYQLFLDLYDIRPPLQLAEDFRSSLDGKVMIKGRGAAGEIIGEIFIKDGLYSKRLDWNDLALSDRKMQPDLVSIGLDPKAFNLNLHVTNLKPLKISNNLAKLNMDTDFLIQGDLMRPVITGRVDTLEGGLVYFRENEFKVVRGVVNFTNPLQSEAHVDIQASTTVKEFPDRRDPRIFNEYDIILNVTSIGDKLVLELESEPPLSDTDILALLTVGMTAEGFAGASSEIGTLEAVSLVTGPLQQEIESNIENLIGINKFKIAPYYSSSKSSVSPRFTVGKRLFGDRLIVTYSTTLDFSEEQFIEVEYFLNENISVLGERDESGRLGGELQYRFRYE